MEKAIEIKRRAQKFIQSGDVDAALEEYDKLAHAEPNEPYHSVVLADLLFKKNDLPAAGERYLLAVDGYEQAGLYKNGIAVLKKMSRLGLSPGRAFERLGQLHKLDGLNTEATLYFMQHADHALRSGDTDGAARSLKLAFEASPDNVLAMERLIDLHLSQGEKEKAMAVLLDAVEQYDKLGYRSQAQRCRTRLAQIDPTRDSGEAPEVADAESAAVPESSRAPDVPHPSPSSRASATTPPQRAVLRVPEKPSTPQSTLLQVPKGPAKSVAVDAGHLPRPELVLDVPNDASTNDETSAPPSSIVEPEPDNMNTTADVRAEASAPGPGIELEDAISRISRSPSGHEDAGVSHETNEAAPAPAIAQPALPPPGHDRDEPSAPVETAHAPIAPGRAEPQPPLEPVHRERPGLRFDSPAREAEDPHWNLLDDVAQHPQISALVQRALEQYRQGAHDAASQLFVRAAQAHDALGSVDAAARVYRALREHMPPVRPALLLWFENCRRRGDRIEGAEVSVELGDEAQSRGDTSAAREWFQRARALDPTVDIVARLAALDDAGPASASAPRGAGGDARSAGDSGRPTPGVTRPVAGAIAPRTMPLASTKSETKSGAPPILRIPTSGSSAAAAPTHHVTAAADPDHIQVVYGYGEQVQAELNDLVARFTREVQEQVSGDAESHYALGVSYLEMGLVDQAIESLRAAGESPAFRATSCELIGRCLLDHGRFEEAVREFHTALDHPNVVGDVALNLRFQLGLALEASGRLDEALDQFEIIYAAQPSFADAVLKIRVLKKTLENE